MEEKTESGIIKISDEAIASIASIAAKKVDGVMDLDGGAVVSIAEMLGVKNASKGIKVDMGTDSVSLDLNIVVSFGTDISDVASKVQESVRDSVESMTGLTVLKANINVNSIRPPKQDKDK